jgi:hypothetical protein
MLRGSLEEALMEPKNCGALEVRRVSSRELIVHDLSYPLDDSRSVVARVRETDDDIVEVEWVRDTNLPFVYLCAEDVLDDLIRHREAGARSRRPEEIPHLPPISRRAPRPQAV